MNAGMPPPPPPQLRDVLIGMWALNAGGMQSQVTFSPDGRYTNTLFGGAQGHSGMWTVSDNPFGGQTITFALTAAFPQTFVGPLGTSPITWPASETWYVTGVQPDRIDINGGVMVRMQTQPGMVPFAVQPPFFASPGMPDYNAEMAKEMEQVADAGRKAFGKLKQVWSGFKKR